MKLVTCTLPNASTSINGIEFAQTADGMVSVPVDDDVAAAFASIPGYTVADAEPAKPAKAAKAATAPEVSKE
jgi:hypothetical protein